MKLRNNILYLAAAIIAIGFSAVSAAEEQPTHKPASPPATRQVDQKEVEAGRAAARADIGKKLIRYEIVGLPSSIDAELKRLAASKYNITVIFGGCSGSPRMDFQRAYQDVVIAYLIAQHGFDPVAKLEKELREKKK